MVLDIIDDFSVFSRQGEKRVKFYKKNKYTIENINMDSRPKLMMWIINFNLIVMKNNFFTNNI